MPDPTPQSLEVALARLEERQVATNAKIDDLKDTITNHTVVQDSRISAVEDRLGLLEAWRWKAVGWSLGVSSAVTALAAGVFHVFGGK